MVIKLANATYRLLQRRINMSLYQKLMDYVEFYDKPTDNSNRKGVELLVQEYADEPEVLDVLEDAFDFMSHNKVDETVFEDMFQLSGTFDAICDVLGFTSPKSKEKRLEVLSEVVDLYKETCWNHH